MQSGATTGLGVTPYLLWGVAVVLAGTLACSADSDDWQQRARVLADRAESRVAELSAEVDTLQRKLEEMTAEKRADLEDNLENLERRRAQLDTVVSELRETTESSMREIQEKTEAEMERLSKAIEKIRKRLTQD